MVTARTRLGFKLPRPGRQALAASGSGHLANLPDVRRNLGECLSVLNMVGVNQFPRVRNIGSPAREPIPALATANITRAPSFLVLGQPLDLGALPPGPCAAPDLGQPLDMSLGSPWTGAPSFLVCAQPLDLGSLWTRPCAAPGLMTALL